MLQICEQNIIRNQSKVRQMKTKVELKHQNKPVFKVAYFAGGFSGFTKSFNGIEGVVDPAAI